MCSVFVLFPLKLHDYVISHIVFNHMTCFTVDTETQNTCTMMHLCVCISFVSSDLLYRVLPLE